MIDRIHRWARSIKGDAIVLFLATRDPRVPWHAKLMAALVVAYAFSPIDLIPDFIPVIGYLDDLIILPLGILLAIRLVPDEVLAELRMKAERSLAKPVSRTGAVVIVGIWLLAAAVVAVWMLHTLQA